MKTEVLLCRCGCGKPVKWSRGRKCWNTYLCGHNRRDMKYSIGTKQKMSETHMGKELSEEHKRHISIAEKGRFVSSETRKKVSEFHKGKKRSIGIRRNISKAVKKRYKNPEERAKQSRAAVKRWENPEERKKVSGKNHHNWRGGVSFEPYPICWSEELKEKIRECDNYTCQLCGKTKELNGRKLAIHHIDYDKDNCNPENLIALCQSCNSEVNSDREIWIRVFQNMIKKKYRKKVA